MALERYQFQVQDQYGNRVPSAFVRVMVEDVGLPLANPVYDDRDGLTTKGNPFQADADGYAYFYVEAGLYRVRAYANGFERTWPEINIGPATLYTDRGEYNPATQYLKDDTVLFGRSTFVARQATLGSAPPDINASPPILANDDWRLLARGGEDGEDGIGTGDVTAQGGNFGTAGRATRSANTTKSIEITTIGLTDEGAIELPEVAEASPSPIPTPGAGRVLLYAKDDQKIYKKDSTGTETELGAGSSPPGSGLPPGYLFGITLSNNAGAPTTDIDIAAGKCRDSTDTVDIEIASAIGKQLNGDWTTGGTPGSTVGGRNSGIAIANTTYHVYAVAKALGADPDIYLHTSTTVATVLTALQAETGGTDYIYARRIGSIVRASNAITGFVQRGDYFYRAAPSADYAAATPGTAAVTRALGVPVGIAVVALHSVSMITSVGSPTYALITPLSTTDTPPSATLFHIASNEPSATGIGTNPLSSSYVQVLTDTASQVRTRVSSSTGTTISGSTHGWIDRRGQDGGL